MFQLASGLYDLITKKQEIPLLFLGLDNAGKTTLYESVRTTMTATVGRNHQHTQLPATQPTVGLNLTRVHVDSVCDCILWDLGGSKSLRPLWRNYYDDCLGLIFVIDDDEARIDEAIEEFKQVISNDRLEGKPVLFVINRKHMSKENEDDLKGSNNLLSIKKAVIDSLLSCSTDDDNRSFKMIQCDVVKDAELIVSSIHWIIDQVSNILEGHDDDIQEL